MSPATLEEVLEQAEALPPDERQLLREVLSQEERSVTFVDLLVAGLLLISLNKTHLSIPELREMLKRAAVASSLARRAEAVRAVRGKYAHLPTGSEAFAAQKRKEIELEDRR
jgi:hypothetical protein